MNEIEDIKGKLLRLNNEAASFNSFKDFIDDTKMSDLLYYILFIKRYSSISNLNNIVSKNDFYSQILGEYYEKDRMINYYSENRNNFYNCNLVFKKDYNLDYIPTLDEIKELVDNQNALVFNYRRLNHQVDAKPLKIEKEITKQLLPHIFIKYFNYKNIDNKDSVNFLSGYYKMYPEYFKLYRESSRNIVFNNKHIDNINNQYNQELENYNKIKKLKK